MTKEIGTLTVCARNGDGFIAFKYDDISEMKRWINHIRNEFGYRTELTIETVDDSFPPMRQKSWQDIYYEILRFNNNYYCNYNRTIVVNVYGGV